MSNAWLLLCSICRSSRWLPHLHLNLMQMLGFNQIMRYPGRARGTDKGSTLYIYPLLLPLPFTLPDPCRKPGANPFLHDNRDYFACLPNNFMIIFIIRLLIRIKFKLPCVIHNCVSSTQKGCIPQSVSKQLITNMVCVTCALHYYLLYLHLISN